MTEIAQCIRRKKEVCCVNILTIKMKLYVSKTQLFKYKHKEIKNKKGHMVKKRK